MEELRDELMDNGITPPEALMFLCAWEEENELPHEAVNALWALGELAIMYKKKARRR